MSQTKKHYHLVIVCLIILLPTMLKSGNGDEPKRLVLIHYANETSPSGREGENYFEMINRLRELDSELGSKIAENLENDPKLFQTALRNDRQSILRSIREKSLPIALVEFDNATARTGRFRYWDYGSKLPSYKKIEMPKFKDYLLDGNPLCTSVGLESALKATADIFDPKDHRFILLALSHGSDEYAMTLKLSRKVDNLTNDDLEDLLSNRENREAPQLGMTKSEFLAALAQEGRQRRIQFELVVLESCRGIFSLEIAQDLPTNVKTLFASGSQNLEFSSIPYGELISDAQDSERVVSLLVNHLDPKFLRISNRNQSDASIYWICFLPLILLASIRVLGRFSSRHSV